MNEENITVICKNDIDKVVETLMNQEIKKHQCLKCCKEYFDSYGHNIGNCDQCYFNRFPKEQVEAFCRRFFE